MPEAANALPSLEVLETALDVTYTWGYEDTREDLRKLYLKATKKYPKCYLAFSSLGDTYYFEGDAVQALALYEHSLELNPYDFLGHFYKANTLFKLARFDQARREYLSALAMKPHRESITRTVRDRVPNLGESFTDRPFMPRALARQEDGHIGIYSSLSAPHWMTYGLCKAVWIGEPGHREARTSNTEHVWSLIEERQCLLSMLEMYYSLREEDEIDPDPDLERIFSVAESGMLDGFILYEIAYRMYGDIMLLYPDQMMEKVSEYVSLHVLPPRQATP